jgi:hypothetical protein
MTSVKGEEMTNKYQGMVAFLKCLGWHWPLRFMINVAQMTDAATEMT